MGSGQTSLLSKLSAGSVDGNSFGCEINPFLDSELKEKSQGELETFIFPAASIQWLVMGGYQVSWYSINGSSKPFFCPTSPA